MLDIEWSLLKLSLFFEAWIIKSSSLWLTKSSSLWVTKSSSFWVTKSSSLWIIKSTSLWVTKSSSLWVTKSSSLWVIKSSSLWVTKSSSLWVTKSSSLWVIKSSSLWVTKSSSLWVTKSSSLQVIKSFEIFTPKFKFFTRKCIAFIPTISFEVKTCRHGCCATMRNNSDSVSNITTKVIICVCAALKGRPGSNKIRFKQRNLSHRVWVLWYVLPLLWKLKTFLHDSWSAFARI